MKYVFHALRMQWRCATQYRASFWMQTLAQLVMSGSELMAVLVLLGRFTSVGQWSGSEIMFFFGMMQMTFAITECVGRGLTAFSRVGRRVRPNPPSPAKSASSGAVQQH